MAAIGVGAANKAAALPSYGFTVSTANQGGASFDASLGAAGFNSAGAVTATFTYNGLLNFTNNQAQNSNNTGDLNKDFFPSGSINSASYTRTSAGATTGGAAGADFTSLTSFLNSSGSASGYQYGSFYTISLGTLAAGTVLTITHDDGASVYQGSTRIGTTTSGPTTVVTETVTIGTAGATTLYYGRENGTPSILQVAVPEPASMAILGAGLVGLGMIRRRRGQQNATAA